MKKIILLLAVFPIIALYGQVTTYTGKVGVNTDAPTQTLDVNGELKGSTIYTETPIEATDHIVMTKTDGTLVGVPKNRVSPLVTDIKGTVISDGTEYVIAQEFSVNMSASQTINSTSPTILSNFNSEIVDNKNLYSDGVFTVERTGVYVLIINVQVSQNGNTSLTNPFIGVINLTDDNTWVCGVNDSFVAQNGNTNRTQNYFIYAGVDLVAGKRYAFAAMADSLGESFNINQRSNFTGSGVYSNVSLRRLK